MKSVKTFLFVSITLIILTSFPLRGWAPHPYFIEPWGEVDVKLYVVALDGVSGHGICNVTRTVEGILEPARIDSVYFRTVARFYAIGEVKINMNVTVVRDWDEYKEVVENAANAILVNAHGEILPVPSGYTREEWVDKIAEAMLYRNSTWVHTGGYPFFYFYLQDEGGGEWREDGFKRLMSHIGKNNTTCHYVYPNRETDKTDMTLAACSTLLISWTDSASASRVQIGKPLNASEFKDELVLPIWGSDDSYLTGAIIKFAKTAEPHHFGYYVHIGAFQTYSAGDVPTDADYWRGFCGAAAAIWGCTFRFAAEDALSNAERAIAKAEAEGRTRSLEEAKQLLQDTKDLFQEKNLYDLGTLIDMACTARDVADNSVKLSFVEVYALQLTVLGVLGVVGASTGTYMVVKRKRNSKEERRTG